MLETNKTGRPALVLHSILGDSDYTNACICFPCHNKTLTAKLGLGGTWLFFCLPAKALAQAGIEKRPPPLHLLRAIHPRELCCGEISRFPITCLCGVGMHWSTDLNLTENALGTD